MPSAFLEVSLSWILEKFSEMLSDGTVAAGRHRPTGHAGIPKRHMQILGIVLICDGEREVDRRVQLAIERSRATACRLAGSRIFEIVTSDTDACDP